MRQKAQRAILRARRKVRKQRTHQPPQPVTTEVDTNEIGQLVCTHRGARGHLIIRVPAESDVLATQAEAFLTHLAPHDQALSDYLERFPGSLHSISRPFTVADGQEVIVQFLAGGPDDCLERDAAEHLVGLTVEYFVQDDHDGLVDELLRTQEVPHYT
jgi:hypothetical protein